MSIEIRVNGKLFEAAAVGHRQLGFGLGSSARSSSVTVTIPAVEFVDLLQDSYDRYVEETRGMWEEDDPEDELAVAGYPPLREVVQHPRLLNFLLSECLTFAFLEAVAPSSSPEWMIESLEAVSVVEGSIEVSGSATAAMP